MPPSTSTFLDLKAQLAKQEAEFAKNRVAGKEKYVRGGVQRPDKKPTVWVRQNKGIDARNARDAEWAKASKDEVELAKEALERKAKQYEKLKRGKTGGLNDAQFEALMVDFDRKAEEEGYDSESSEDRDESLAVPQKPNDYEEDPVIEYNDEFGRTRTARRSEVPRNLLPREEEVEAEYDNDPYVIHDPNYFPTYEQTAEKIAAVEAELVEDNPATHYDATKEVRPHGAGFYQFSKDEETRQRQMEELKRSREETEKARVSSGAAAGKEVKPGLEKRKREIEERRKAIEAKRRKKEPVKDEAGGPTPVEVSPPNPEPEQKSQEEQPKRARKPPKIKPEPKSKEEIAKSADDFLASLERDIMSSRK
ncbi:hypothetical protein M422DRAFT_26635 [Sphaerobolus stellatus SS14]|nr:hypothetical protein M422DRAFT_26635 [Sphaerobolus stellatus SS14]